MEPDEIDVKLRPYEPRDRAQIDRWLAAPTLPGWMGSRSGAQARLSSAQSSPSGICRMIASGGVVIGYAQAIDGALDGQEPAGTWCCDVLVGDPAYQGRGFGAAALDLLVREVFETTLAPACAIAVPIRNERAARACERLDFHWVRVIHDPVAGPTWIMTRDRPRR